MTEETLDTGRGILTLKHFWKRVKRRGAYDCWEWTGRTEKGRAKIIMRDHGRMSCQRISWLIHFGPIPDGKSILNSCLNKVCVNPAHLSSVDLRSLEARRFFFMSKVIKDNGHWIWVGGFLEGIPQYNAVNARRVATLLFGEGDLPKGHIFLSECRNQACVKPAHIISGAPGELYPSSKLTPKVVLEIRNARKEGVSLSILAEKYGLDPSAISLIGRGLRWRVVTEDTRSCQQ